MSKNKLAVKRNNELSPRTFGNLLEDFFTDPWAIYRQPEFTTFKLDVREDDKAYTVEAEMPGVKKEDITIDLDDGALTIGVAAREKISEDGKKLVRNERYYSYMERTIYLPTADGDGVEAKLNNGELVITVPKAPEMARKKKIEVK